MNAHDAIKLSTDMSSMLSEAYLGDLSDADLLHRPAPDAPASLRSSAGRPLRFAYACGWLGAR